MKKICILFLLSYLLAGFKKTNAQCATGYKQVTLNWDYLDYFTWSGSYDNSYLSSFTQAYRQHFAFGLNRLTIDVPLLFLLSGENNVHSGHNGSYATDGADVQFSTILNSTSTVTLTFEQEVLDLRFSIYDLDNNQRLNVVARNAAGNTRNVVLSRANGSSGMTFNSNPGTNPQARGISGNYGSGDSRGTVNIDIDGPVKTISLSFSNASGDFWLSDITACSPGDFPTDYYEAARPFNGQPGYILHAFNNSVYALNPATGRSTFVFSDPAVPGNGFINSMAYDQANHVLYYVYTQTDPGPPRSYGGNKMLRKYDFNTETIVPVLNDITGLGIPVSDLVGVESGGAAFYNGSLYLGIEPADDDAETNREAVIWRIDFNALQVPEHASQVFAVPLDDGDGDLLHDWADFVIKDGVLYDFDAADDETDIYQFNLLTGNATVFSSPSFTPGQPAIDWDGNIYQVYANAGDDVDPYVALYNPLTGTIGTPRNITTAPGLTGIPNLGDAAEGFRPKSDFGDAPASYTPNPLAPAMHEKDVNLRLGSSFDNEWNFNWSALANSDGADEDGIGAAPALNVSGTLTYRVNNISVYNNTGSNATLAGWLDYNFNGLFEAGEGVVITVPSRTNPQQVTLTWNNIHVPHTTWLRTFLRLRITSASNGMNATNMNGWFSNGEVEDFPVVIGVVLSKELPPIPVTRNDSASVDVGVIKILPNPVIDVATLQLYSATNTQVEIQLIDNSGKKMLHLERAVVRGVNKIVLNNLGAWPAGVYTARILLNNKTVIRRIVIGR